MPRKSILLNLSPCLLLQSLVSTTPSSPVYSLMQYNIAMHCFETLLPCAGGDQKLLFSNVPTTCFCRRFAGCVAYSQQSSSCQVENLHRFENFPNNGQRLPFASHCAAVANPGPQASSILTIASDPQLVCLAPCPPSHRGQQARLCIGTLLCWTRNNGSR